jgi:hypothetical protein
MRHLFAPPVRVLLPGLITAAVLGLLVTPLALRRRPSASPSEGTTAARPAHAEQSAREAFGRVPLGFEANRGQTESTVDFIARGAGYALFLKPSEAVFVLRDEAAASSIDESRRVLNPQSDLGIPQSASPQARPGAQQSKVLRMRLVGARASASAAGENELEGRANYLLGKDPAGWRTNVATYGRVRYAEVYPGVDLVYYGNQRQLEYDFRVAPGADPRAVALEFKGADRVEVNDEGELLLKVGGQTVRQPRPVVYQEAAGARREVAGGYAVGRDGRVRFALGDYDPALPLVIDPVIVYSTFLGGSLGDTAWSVAVDSSGSVYLAGFTISTNFPTVNPIQAAHAGVVGSQDAFVAKLNAAGNALVYSTYLGGDGNEQARAIAVDSAGNACVAGFTNATNFPLANAIQSTLGPNGQDTFVAKLNPTGNAFVYSTYLGGDGALEFAEGIAVDSAGNVYVTGDTNSTDFPTANALQATRAGGVDAFLTKFNPAGTALVYSTYLGGSTGVASEIGRGVAVDSAGNAYVVGSTDATDFPTVNPVQAANAGGSTDGFVAKVNAAGSALVYSTYLGGSAQDDVSAVAVDSAGQAHVTGVTFSTNFPTANAFQPVNDTSQGISQEVFITKLNAAGSAFVFSTYLGGTGGEVGEGIAVDAAGNVYVAGGTGSFNNFPTANALQCQRLGTGDPFVTKLNAAGSALAYSTYYGGSGNASGEIARGLTVDSAGNAYVVGNTSSVDFPVVNPAQGAFAGGAGLAGDSFLFKLSDAPAGPASSLQFTQTTVPVQEDLTAVTLTVQRAGDTSGAVTVDYTTMPPTLAAASERSDYTTALGTLRFAAGETTKTFEVLVNEDSFAESSENISVVLSNPTGGATLSCAGAVATIQITDDVTEPATNVIDDPTTFVGQHYHDFLNRQADATGLNFWTSQLTACGADVACIDRARTAVSQAFFLSIEYQNTAFYVFRIYKASFADSAARPRGMPRYREFLRDQREVGRGVVVNQAGWEAVLEENKREFARQWVQRSEFLAQFPLSMNRDEYVTKLIANLGITLTDAEFSAVMESYTQTVEGRATTLRNVVELPAAYNRQFNAGFVLSQYIGYLRRNPNDAPEPGLDYAGFDFWLAKLDSFSLPGENVRDPATAQQRVQRAEMVRAFILSDEYRKRFGQQ